MPFPQLQALGFTASEDSSKFSETPVDPAIRGEFEGGFISTRPRFTRPDLEVITTGFTDISDADWRRLRDFYRAARGGSSSFYYIHPVTDELLTVRFLKPLKASYVGMGGNHRWDIGDLELEIV
jgi:hypothetical protein